MWRVPGVMGVRQSALVEGRRLRPTLSTESKWELFPYRLFQSHAPVSNTSIAVHLAGRRAVLNHISSSTRTAWVAKRRGSIINANADGPSRIAISTFAPDMQPWTSDDYFPMVTSRFSPIKCFSNPKFGFIRFRSSCYIDLCSVPAKLATPLAFATEASWAPHTNPTPQRV